MQKSLKSLAVELSKLKKIEAHNADLEQHDTPSEIAAEIIWAGFMTDDIKDKTIADLGAGSGILGIGALLMDAKNCIFIEKDRNAVKVLKENLSKFNNADLIETNVDNFEQKVDVVIQNPPFGSVKKHADSHFLKKAFEISNTIYSFHNASTEDYIKKMAKKNRFRITTEWLFDFPLPKTQGFHFKPTKKIKVAVYRMQSF